MAAVANCHKFIIVLSWGHTAGVGLTAKIMMSQGWFLLEALSFPPSSGYLRPLAHGPITSSKWTVASGVLVSLITLTRLSCLPPPG